MPLTRPHYEPLWPLQWVHLLPSDPELITNIVRWFFLCTALLGLLWYRHGWARCLVFLGVWQAHALESYFSLEPNHQWYPWVYCSLILVFLPDKAWLPDPSRAVRYRFLLVIWWAQAMSLLIYTMAGLWKVITIFWQIGMGQISGLSPYALSLQVARWLPQLQTEAPLGAFVINYPYVVWPAYLAVQYLQVTAIWAMVRPSLQKLYAVELILFHIGTYLIMGISFHPFILLVIAMFFRSPFMPEKTSWRQILHDLPGIGLIASIIEKRIWPRLRT